MEKFYPMIIAAVLLCCYLIFKEWKRENRVRQLLRILAVILLVASLLFLIIPITRQSTKTTNSKQLQLLTKGFANKLLKNESYFTLDSSVLEELGPKQVKYLPDLSYYLRSHADVAGLKVFGYGLGSDELANLSNLSYAFKPATDAGGIQTVSWPNVLPATAALNVQGVYENKAGGPIQLVLEGAGSRLDSLTIAVNQKTTFNLSTRPKQFGKAIYHLIVKQGSKQLKTEKIPFTIIEKAKVKIMVLAASPDFEFKFLRNWLLENKYPAYFRTRISKDKFSTDAVNMAGKQSKNFSPSIFKDFDLVIADDEELAELSPAARISLNSEISNGMGLLVRLNEAKPISSFAKGFRMNATADSIPTSIALVLTGELTKLKAVPINQPFFVAADPDKAVLIESVKGSIFLSSKLYGTGTVAASTISSTYNWQLSGATGDYAQYWSHVINKIARKEQQLLSWRVNPQFPVVAERASITFQTKSDKPLPQFSVNKEVKSTQQHPLLPFSWQSSAWLDHPGWTEFKVDDQPAEEFFVYKPEDWTSVKIRYLQVKNEEFARNSSKKTAIQINNSFIVKEEVSKWWFFVLFLISICFLWFETKLLQ
jgi:hypothetical protein